LNIYFCNFGIDVLTPAIFSILERNAKQNKDKREIQLRDAMKELWRTEGMKL
jgi:UTP-glucose-1-phosphate uridylyltransferase